MKNVKPCPECGQKNLFATTANSGGGYGPILLPGLGSLFSMAKFDIVACADCGLTRFFAATEARDKLAASEKWQRA